MRNKWLGWTWSLAFGLCVVMPQKAAAQGTSTPEERARWVEITHKLESNPLDETANKDGESALNRLSNAHDIHVPLCSALLGQFNDAKYKYRHEITRQYMLASGAFIIENPDKAGDTKAMNLAAVQSALKVYSGVLRQKPDAKWKPFEDLLKKQSQGKLDESLQKTCGGGSASVNPKDGTLHVQIPVLVAAKVRQ